MKDLIKTLEEKKDNENFIEQQSLLIKEQITLKPFPSSLTSYLESEILKSFSTSDQSRFAVRSSGVIEDLKSSSLAGLYDSYMNVKYNNLSEYIKKVWASTFNLRAILERMNLGLNNYGIAVIIQLQIDSYISGVATSRVLSNGYNGIHISATYGLGEGAVNGEISGDSYICHPEHFSILEKIKGSKEFKYVCHEEKLMILEKVEEELSGSFVLRDPAIRCISKIIKDIKEFYCVDVDVEFAIDQSQKFWITQVRELVNLGSLNIDIIDNTSIISSPIAMGKYSIPGISCGKLRFISSLEDLSTKKILINHGEIVLSYVTTNTWTTYLQNVGGIITKEGSSSSHAMLLSRERHIPCVIGIQSNFEELINMDGEEIRFCRICL